MLRILKILGVILFILAGAVATYHFIREDHFKTVEEVRTRINARHSQYVDWNGMKVHMLEDGEGPTLLIIHGFGGHSQEFDELVPLLADKFRILRFDLPGFGLSDIPDMGSDGDVMGLYQDFIKHVLDTYCGNDKVYLLGNSLGGWIAWETAANYPDRIEKMMLLSPAGYEMDKVSKTATGWLKNPIGKYFISKGISKTVADGIIMANVYDFDQVDQRYSLMKYYTTNKKGNLDWLTTLAYVEAIPDTEKIKTIQTPTLLLWGHADQIIPFSHAAKFDRDLPNCKFIDYEKCGHVPMIDLPEQTAKDIFEFVGM